MFLVDIKFIFFILHMLQIAMNLYFPFFINLFFLITVIQRNGPSSLYSIYLTVIASLIALKNVGTNYRKHFSCVNLQKNYIAQKGHIKYILQKKRNSHAQKGLNMHLTYIALTKKLFL